MSRPARSVTTLPLHVLCACDTFKGTLAPDKVGEAVEAGYRAAWSTLRDRQPAAAATAECAGVQRGNLPPPHALPAVTVPATAVQQPSPLFRFNMTTVPAKLLAESLVESLSATRTAAMADHSACFTHTPMSDGGAGLLDSVTFAASRTTDSAASLRPADALQLERVYVPATHPITGPLGSPLVTAASATAAVEEKEAKDGAAQGVSFACDVARRVLVVEMAEAAGLPRIPHRHQRNPLYTTSYGVGEVITYAIAYMEAQIRRREEEEATADAAREAPKDNKGAEQRHRSNGVRLFLGIGGSATNDGGLGALQALGLDIYVKAPSAAAATPPFDTAPSPSVSSASLMPSVAVKAEEEVLLTEAFRGEHLGRVTRVHMSEKMLRLFPYLPRAASAKQHDDSNGGDSNSGPSVEQERSRPATTSADGLHICEVCLICDVFNPLVGPRGATYTFGPQKCAPPPPQAHAATAVSAAGQQHAVTLNDGKAPSAVSTAAEVGDDAAVGAITSDTQRALLDSLESGMRHAAAAVVASTWRQLVSASERERLRAAASSVPVSEKNASPESAAGTHHNRAHRREDHDDKNDDDDEVAVLATDDLMNRPGGGGAGGMSGFFRYVLQACYVPGADLVGGLLGLYETPYVARLLGSESASVEAPPAALATDGSCVHDVGWLSRSSSVVCAPRGRLFHEFDVVVSGEGSFDAQTIESHKTVGRLLEMCTVANAYRLWKCFGPLQCASEINEGGDDDDDGDTQNPVRVERQHWQHPCSMIREFVVVCGRDGFGTYEACQSEVARALSDTLLVKAPLPRVNSMNGAAIDDDDDAPPSAPPACEDLDLQRLDLYLDDLWRSPAFHRFCQWHQNSSEAFRESQATLSKDVILRSFCMPRLTVLPLTPTLFSFEAATQRADACVRTAVAAMLEDAASRLQSTS